MTTKIGERMRQQKHRRHFRFHVLSPSLKSWISSCIVFPLNLDISVVGFPLISEVRIRFGY
ncbi:MAG: hypothetical protein VYA99_04320 [Pseudomonadota bacterium]|nr:hypothetical protein [Pseudomonadota bacterium]